MTDAGAEGGKADEGFDTAWEELAEALTPAHEVDAKVETMTHTIDKLLTHADEQMAVLDMVKRDSTRASRILLTQLQGNADRIARVFEMIDTLEDVVAEVGAGVTSMEEKAAAVEQSHRPSTFRSFMTVFRGRDSEIDAEQLKLSEPVLDCDALMRKLHIKPMSVHQNKYLQPDEQNDGEVV